MDLMLLRIFQRQISCQCKYLLKSAAELDRGINQRDIEHIFFFLQNLLTAGANISKAFWGQGGKLAPQRKPLRDSCGVADDSPLRAVRMRNHFEHFDERLDKWWLKSKRHNYADLISGPKGRSIAGLETVELFRLFDPTTTDLIFWGEEFNVGDIVQEVQRILPIVMEEAGKPHWVT